MERIVEIEKFNAEEIMETSLRPSALDDYIGQEQIKKSIAQVKGPMDDRSSLER